MSPLYNFMPSLPDWFWYAVTFFYGAIVGSFLNVVIYRLPLGESVVSGTSHCPQCNRYLTAWDNIPLFAFLLLGAKCRYCRTPISWRYFTIELLTACIWVALFHQISGADYLSWIDFVAQALFASVLVAMVFIDLDHFIAPDELNIVGFIIGLGRDAICLFIAYRAGSYLWLEYSAKFAYFGWLPRAIPGALAYGGALYLVSLLGFVYYAREPGENLPHVLKRFFFLIESEPEADIVKTPDSEEDIVALPPSESEEEFETEEAPPRLRFSPGFVSLLGTLFLATVTGFWAIFALIIPWLGFALFARHSGESVSRAARRFFRSSEEDNYARSTVDLAAEEDADQFARDAETGVHGGMGLGDAKLALAIGAILGPALALLSLLVATFIGAVTGIAIARIHRRSLKYGVPFVPFMAIGAIVTMLYGHSFIGWYLHKMDSSAYPEPPSINMPYPQPTEIVAPRRHRVRPIPVPLVP